jgi:hypothetical protein|tara:strand:- start:39 stop:170 length:132 start_codon:yes stop_codon:yes gene_type:complete
LVKFFEKYGKEIPEEDLLGIDNAWSKIHNWLNEETNNKKFLKY